MERGSRERSSSAGSEKMERVGGRWGKNGRTLFDRPNSTVVCSASGRKEGKKKKKKKKKMSRAPSIFWCHLNYIITYTLCFTNVFKLKVCTVYQMLLEWPNEGV